MIELPSRRSPQTGIVLLIVLAILGLMSVLAISFVSMARLEKSISRNYVDKVRAVMVAESGVEHATARILQFKPGVPDVADLQQLRYNPSDPNALLIDATQPSFASQVDIHNDGTMDTVSGVVGSSRTANGDVFMLKVSDTSGKLNLNDSNSHYNIDTDPWPDSRHLDEITWTDGSGTNFTDNDDINAAAPRLTRILEILVTNLFSDPVLGLDVATTVMDARATLPGGKFSTMDQLRSVLVDSSVMDTDEFQQLLQHITLWSWQDPNVILPTFTLDITVPDEDRAAIPQNAWDDSWDIYFGMDMETDSYEMDPRCPINVNAASSSLLQALIEPIQGWYLYEGPVEVNMTKTFYSPYYNGGTSFYFGDRTTTTQGGAGVGLITYERDTIYGVMRKSAAIGDPEGLAQQIHDRITGVDEDSDGYPAVGDEAKPFQTWEEFEAFLRLPEIDIYIEPAGGYVSLFGPGQIDAAWYTDYYRDFYVDLILANFNPNSQLNDFNPDRHRFRHVDKAQLTQFTTELCFEPTGRFELQSLGLVYNDEGLVVAQSTVHAVTELWTMLRYSTQADFMRGFEQSGVDNNLASFFSPNTEGFFATAGIDDGTGGFGYTVQSYPEPVVNNSTWYVPPTQTDFNYLDDSTYDGALSLSVYRIRETETITEPRLLVNFDTTVKPQVFGRRAGLPNDRTGLKDSQMTLATDDMLTESGSSGIWSGTGGSTRYYTPNILATTRLTSASATPATPGILHPDGSYSDAGRTLNYRAANVGRFYGMQGTLNFWMKPNYHPGLSNRIRTFYTDIPLASPFPGFSPCGMWYFPVGNSNVEVTGKWNVPGSHSSFINGPTRNITMGWWQWVWWTAPSFVFEAIQYGRPSETVTHNFPGHDSVAGHDTNRNQFNYEPHEWTHIHVSWDKFGNEGLTSPELMGRVNINRQAIGADRSWYHGSADIFPAQYAHDFWRSLPMGSVAESDPADLFGPLDGYPPDVREQIEAYINTGFPPNYIRFGEYSGYRYRNWSFDGTVADIVGFAEGPYLYDPYAIDGTVNLTPSSDLFTFGRYLSQVQADGTVGEYTSKALDLSKMFKRLNPTDSVTLRSATWTLYWPQYNRDGSDANEYLDVIGVNINGDSLDTDDPSDSTYDDPLAEIRNWPDAWDPICVDVAVNRGGGDQWLAGADKAAMATSPGRSDFRSLAISKQEQLQYRKGDTFRFRTFFLLEDGQTLFEAPVLDDITFAFVLNTPKMVFWQVN